MSANSGFMAARSKAPDELDDFPTPPWATRALTRFLARQGEDLRAQHAWEPGCNRGHMARPLREAFGSVFASDVHAYGWPGQDAIADFLMDWRGQAPDVDWIITNPPFLKADAFVRQGLSIARRGVAVLVRSSFHEGADRYERLFRPHPETWCLPFVERVVMWRGVLLDPEVKVATTDPNTGELRIRKPSTAAAYSWFVWRVPNGRRLPSGRLRRIPPCRRALTRPGDYPPLPIHLRPPEVTAA